MGFSGFLQGSEQAAIGAIKADSAQVAGALQSDCTSSCNPQLSTVSLTSGIYQLGFGGSKGGTRVHLLATTTGKAVESVPSDAPCEGAAGESGSGSTTRGSPGTQAERRRSDCLLLGQFGHRATREQALPSS